MIKLGTTYELTFSVTQDMTARAVGSGTLDVLATPILAAKLEEAAWRAVAPALPEGCSTVGTRLELSHLSPTPVGMRVTCRAEVTKMDDRFLLFSLSASDSAGLIGEGTHQRVVIQAMRFLDKAQKKVELS